jgi:hypothetical protein
MFGIFNPRTHKITRIIATEHYSIAAWIHAHDHFPEQQLESVSTARGEEMAQVWCGDGTSLYFSPKNRPAPNSSSGMVWMRRITREEFEEALELLRLEFAPSIPALVFG